MTNIWFSALFFIACFSGQKKTETPTPQTPQPQTTESVTIIGDSCCCEHIVEGDIIKEDLIPINECPSLEDGQCIAVDPGRLTPHPCCPDAVGDRCGGSE